jgi:hypothetical protein
LACRPDERPAGIAWRQPLLDAAEVDAAAVVERVRGPDRLEGGVEQVERLGSAYELVHRPGPHVREEVVPHERREDERTVGIRRQRRRRPRHAEHLEP